MQQLDGNFSEDGAGSTGGEDGSSGCEDEEDDDNGNAESVDDSRNDDKNKDTLLFTCANARSLNNKALSLVNMFEETEIHMCLLNETWIRNSIDTEERLTDLSVGEGIEMIRRDRKTGRGGRVAILYKKSLAKLENYEMICNTDNSEIVAAIGKDTKLGRKILIISVYLPTSIKQTKVLDIASDVSDTIAKAKTSFPDITVFVGGDMNGKKFDKAVEDYPDIRKIKTGPNRGRRTIDLIFTNAQKITEALVLKPLESEEGIRSDHGVVFCTVDWTDQIRDEEQRKNSKRVFRIER